MRIRLTAILALGLVAAAPAARASGVERILKAELSGADLESFRVENLLGTMTRHGRRRRPDHGDGDGACRRTPPWPMRSASRRRPRAKQRRSASATRMPRVSTFRYVEPGSDRGWGFSGFSVRQHLRLRRA